MENIEKVTTYLREKYEAEGRDAARETLRVIRTKDGHLTANLVTELTGVFMIPLKIAIH